MPAARLPCSSPAANDGTTTITAPYSRLGLTAAHPNVYQVTAKAADDTTGFVGEDALAAGDIQYTFYDGQSLVANPTNVGTYTVLAELTDQAEEKWSNYTVADLRGTGADSAGDRRSVRCHHACQRPALHRQGLDPIANIAVTGGRRR